MFQFDGVSFENYFVWAQENSAFASQEINEPSFTCILYPADHCQLVGKIKGTNALSNWQKTLWIN